MNENLIEIKNVSIDYKLKKYDIRAVTHVSLPLKRGKITALVGESGSGKTTLASSLLRCISEPGVIAEGEICFYADDDSVVHIESLENKELNHFRWEKISMVFQAAQSALNPIYTIYQQFKETVQEHHLKWSKEKLDEKLKELFQIVKLDYERVSKAYPHELSGGMKQRVMIAFALLFDPQLIILDEPTTALDVITQDYIFKILKEINQSKGITMLLMTHDISVVAKFADYVAVMYAGRIMEYGIVQSVFIDQFHPYTQGLIHATPSLISDIDELEPIVGTPPDLRNLPTGCVFHPRCKHCFEMCQAEEPMAKTKDQSIVKCHLYDDKK